MLDYNKINEIFGAPLNVVNRPHVPFHIKGWHLVVGIGIVALASYGGYQLYLNHLKAMKNEE